MAEPFTVGALKALLADTPDEYAVVGCYPGDPSVGIFEATFEVTGAGLEIDYDDDGEPVTIPAVTIILSD